MDKRLAWYQDFYARHQRRTDPDRGYMIDPAIWLASWQTTGRLMRQVSRRAAITDARLTLARLDARKPAPPPRR